MLITSYLHTIQLNWRNNTEQPNRNVLSENGECRDMSNRTAMC